MRVTWEDLHNSQQCLYIIAQTVVATVASALINVTVTSSTFVGLLLPILGHPILKRTKENWMGSKWNHLMQLSNSEIEPSFEKKVKWFEFI